MQQADAQPQPTIVSNLLAAEQNSFAAQREYIVSFVKVLTVLACQATSDRDCQQSMSGTLALTTAFLVAFKFERTASKGRTASFPYSAVHTTHWRCVIRWIAQ